jgi:hypothetical protein
VAAAAAARRTSARPRSQHLRVKWAACSCCEGIRRPRRLILSQFVFEPRAIAELEARCEFVRTLDDGWTREYRERNTDDVWRAQQVHGEGHGGGLPYWVRLPVPDTAALVELALHAPALDDRLVAAHLLTDAPDTWPALMAGWEIRIEEDGPASWVASAVRATGVLAGSNRRPTSRKAPAEIDRDVAHFHALAARAAKLVLRVEASSSDA